VRARKGSESIDPNYWPRATFLHGSRALRVNEN
jgi:hypothetical protein